MSVKVGMHLWLCVNECVCGCVRGERVHKKENVKYVHLSVSVCLCVSVYIGI